MTTLPTEDNNGYSDNVSSFTEEPVPDDTLLSNMAYKKNSLKETVEDVNRVNFEAINNLEGKYFEKNFLIVLAVFNFLNKLMFLGSLISIFLVLGG